MKIRPVNAIPNPVAISSPVHDGASPSAEASYYNRVSPAGRFPLQGGDPAATRYFRESDPNSLTLDDLVPGFKPPLPDAKPRPPSTMDELSPESTPRAIPSDRPDSAPACKREGRIRFDRAPRMASTDATSRLSRLLGITADSNPQAVKELIDLYVDAGVLPPLGHPLTHAQVSSLAQRLARLSSHYGLSRHEDPFRIARIINALETLRRLSGIAQPIDDWEYSAIKKLYWALSRRYHSDSRFSGATPDPDKFRQASAAWGILSGKSG